ncbi:hypothetical protein KL86DYS1_30964 [uncultured Dysgonomonas sp.]|uniref:Uncharacterized protein n=1 Tax=uncultured Dysgonomonas sp. TaxID=206096 RepID=A0A212JZG3_9BACT|nr:hypothetical protein KL86DYS1_30964 [uncultured Dysgonomonas sp.]
MKNNRIKNPNTSGNSSNTNAKLDDIPKAVGSDIIAIPETISPPF